MAKPRTLYDKIWDDHVVDQQPDGTCLIYIDRHLVHEVTSPQAFEGLRTTGRKVRAPEKTLAGVDHNVPTTDRSKPNEDPESIAQIEALAQNGRDFGIGTSEVEHVLATQTLIQKKAKNMRVTVDGKLPTGVAAKDIILAIIGEIGTAGGTGSAIEYAGEAIRALSMEGRMTGCNMSIEAGGR